MTEYSAKPTAENDSKYRTNLHNKRHEPGINKINFNLGASILKNIDL